MRAEEDTPPVRPETAGMVEEEAGDVDADTEDTLPQPPGETPGDAAGEMGISGADAG
jgi:hypothetical protein